MAVVLTSTNHSLFSAAFGFFTVLVIISSLPYFIKASNGGFSVDLIHRDSPKSPFYNPFETPFGRLRNALRRSINRASHVNPASISTSKVAQVINNNGEYLLNISIGTPPVEILAIADTGSDLLWTQCKPCSQCYKQKAPLFDPKSSLTYKRIPCSSSACTSLEDTTCGACTSLEDATCGSDGSFCQYTMYYGDRSYTIGTLSRDTITLGTSSGRSVSLPRTIFGCGFNDAGTFNENGSGIMGLGGGPYSAISQMKSLIGGKFSYCLVPISQTNSSSTMNFGARATVTGSGIVSTPMVSKAPSTFYYLTLESLSVGGGKRLDFHVESSKASEVVEGNIIIDSGTTLTLLPGDLYSQLESEVRKAINLERVPDPQNLLSLCYKTHFDIDAPTITAHFKGADVNLRPLNTFIKTADDVVCFTFVPTPNRAIFGNLAQMNFLVGYDLNARTVSFKPTDCTKL